MPARACPLDVPASGLGGQVGSMLPFPALDLAANLTVSSCLRQNFPFGLRIIPKHPRAVEQGLRRTTQSSVEVGV